MEEKKINVESMVEDIVGCKWSISILDLLDKGINRPGAMTREVDGLTTKVLNERLRKLLRYKIVVKKEYEEIPPRVEYILTDFGFKFLKIVNEIRTLEKEIQQGFQAYFFKSDFTYDFEHPTCSWLCFLGSSLTTASVCFLFLLEFPAAVFPTEKTETCFSRFELAQFGQLG